MDGNLISRRIISGTQWQFFYENTSTVAGAHRRKISLVAGEQTLLGCKYCALEVAALASLIVYLDGIIV
jgi:hypothetical protein